MAQVNLGFNYPPFIMPALFEKVKVVNIVAGRRTGKTLNTAQWLLDQLLVNPDSVDYPLSGLWVDTTQNSIDKYVDRYFRPMLGSLWTSCHWRQDKKVLKMPNGAYIDFGSAERPEVLEGQGYGRAVVNEAGIVLKNPALWDNTIMPMIKGDTTQIRVIGTPKGKNKFHRLTQIYKTYHFSCYDSPFWDPIELDRIKTETPEIVWKQEYLAEFVDGEGSVFRNIGSCVSATEIQSGTAGHTYVMSADLAKHQDFTVLMVADVNSREVVYMDRFNQIDWTFQKQRIVNTWQKFNHPRLIVDASGPGSPIYDDLRAAGLNIEPFVFTGPSKKELIWDLAIAIDNQDLRFYSWDVLIRELESFGYEMTRAGNVTYNAPEGLHDDAVIALALINKLLKKKRTVKLSVI